MIYPLPEEWHILLRPFELFLGLLQKDAVDNKCMPLIATCQLYNLGMPDLKSMGLNTNHCQICLSCDQLADTVSCLKLFAVLKKAQVTARFFFEKNIEKRRWVKINKVRSISEPIPSHSSGDKTVVDRDSKVERICKVSNHDTTDRVSKLGLPDTLGLTSRNSRTCFSFIE